MKRQRSGWLLPLSIVVALLLALLPLSDALSPLRPYWLALVLIYWMIEEGEQHGLWLAFLCGLAGDLVVGTLLGEQSFRLVIMTALLQRFRNQIRFFPPVQQAGVVAALLLNDRLIVAAIRFVSGQLQAPLATWLAPLAAAVLWIPLFAVMDMVRQGRRR